MFKLPCVGGGNLCSLELQIVIKQGGSRMYPVLELLLSALLCALSPLPCVPVPEWFQLKEGRKQENLWGDHGLLVIVVSGALLKCVVKQTNKKRLLKHTWIWAFGIARTTVFSISLWCRSHNLPLCVGFMVSSYFRVWPMNLSRMLAVQGTATPGHGQWWLLGYSCQHLTFRKG